jgi:hypothetical protein
VQISQAFAVQLVRNCSIELKNNQIFRLLPKNLAKLDFQTVKSCVLIHFDFGIEHFIFSDMILCLEFKDFTLDTFEVRRDIEHTIFLGLGKQLLKQTYIHLKSQLYFVIVLIGFIDLSELQDYVHQKLFPELPCPVLN